MWSGVTLAVSFAVEFCWAHDDGVTWVNESSRVRRIEAKSGFARPGDLVAAPGFCKLTLDNSDKRFSPGYAAGPLYGNLVPRREVRIKATSGGTTWTIWTGYIEAIRPDAGEWGGGECVIECVDLMTILDRVTVSAAYSAEKQVSTAITSIVGSVITLRVPDYLDNSDTLYHYGRGWQSDRTTCVQALQQICESYYGRFYASLAGPATYVTRDVLLDASTASVATVDVDSNVVDELPVVIDMSQLCNRAMVVCYPVETVGALQVIWTNRLPIRLGPGQTRIFYTPFNDDNGVRCGAVDVVAPVATTDYLVNDQPDGSGYNYTTSPHFAIATSIEAARAKITVSNTASGPLYMTLLQVRGKPLRVFDPVVVVDNDTTSQAKYEKRSVTLDLPMLADDQFAAIYAGYLTWRFANPALAAEQLLVRGLDTLGSANVFSIKLLDRLTITDVQSGLSAVKHLVRGIEYDLKPGTWSVLYHLEQADPNKYYLAGVTGYDEVGSSSLVIGF